MSYSDDGPRREPSFRLGHDKLTVVNRRCDECLFSPNRIVDARRMKEVLERCDRNDNHFECHKETLADRHGMCKGFYDKEPYQTLLMRLAAMTQTVVFTDERGEEVACPIPQGGLIQ